MHRFRRLLIVAQLLVTAFCFLHLFLFLHHGLNVYDDGVAAYGAVRVAGGEVPYRDFWTMYAPGQFYALAGVYMVSGYSLMAGRVLTAAMLIGIVAALGAAVGVKDGRRSAWPAVMLGAIWVSSFEGRTPAIPCSVLLSMGSGILVLRFLESRKARNAVAAGLLAGIAAWYRHDLAACAAVAGSLVMFLKPGDTGNLRDRLCGPLRYAGGAAIAVVPVAALLLWLVPFDVLVQDLVVFPWRVYPAVRRLPFPLPGLSTAAFYFVPLICAVGVVRGARQKSPYFLLFGVMGLLFMGQACVRSDIAHLFPAVFPAIVVFVLIAPHPSPLPVGEGGEVCTALPVGEGGGEGGGARRLLYIVLLVLAFLSFLQPFVLQVVNVAGLVSAGPAGFVVEKGRAEGIRLRADMRSYVELVQYIREHVPPEERIFVGNRRHDRIAINDVILYFLAERQSATKYHELHPGLATTEKYQRRIVDELEAAGTDTVVLGDFDNTEPNEGGESSGVRVLDEYLAAGFVAVTNFGDYSVMRRRAPAGPGPGDSL